MKRHLFLFLFFAVTLPLFSQYIPEDIRYTTVYDFLDEMANNGVISINTAVKPYSRHFIAQKLEEIERKSSQLTKRQRKEVIFYLNDYALERDTLPQNWDIVENSKTDVSLWPPGVFYRTDSMRIRITPIIGDEWIHNNSASVSTRTIGADFQGTFGKHLTVYASLRDNSQIGQLLSKGEQLFAKQTSPYTGRDTLMRIPSYLTLFPGAAYKLHNGGINAGADYSEMRGGIYYSWGWGNVGLAKDYIEWGDNYHGSNILSGNSPSFPFIAFNIKPVPWFELNYFHGWLTSDVLDSTDYYMYNTGQKEYRYKNKFIAANMITFRPTRELYLSFGNSIIYSERSIQPAYLIPLAFYKSMDHSLTMGSENQNSQMFFNFSSRNIRHLHLFLSTYIDEFSVARLSPSNPQKNPISWKIGGELSDYPFSDFSFIGEFTRNYALTYKHFIPSLDFTSGGYTLGSYLWDNAQEIYLAAQYKPICGLLLQGSYTDAVHGNEYDYVHALADDILSQPFMKDKVWQNKTLSLSANYEIANNVLLTFEADYSNITGYTPTDPIGPGEYRTNAQGYLDMYTPLFLQGKKLTITFGLKVGI
ncbi:hypothetical protein [Microbacter margulisiae]|uniref:Capsule assembly protein Wzi n=1 Tax=Microbacter margulisiae TaxID=1350067 RepID=A0A7W5DSZ6_9PORP|nr:hypothetical protein [Microbacter margulisiae]MBB3188034.1 hypothetical protein [Microbacter margulisiae]